jgi:hypothetical protein
MSQEDPFTFGDRTILALRNQPALEVDDYGTMVLPAGKTRDQDVPIPHGVSDDPIARLEQKLDAALRIIQTLQHKLDSIDATIARIVNR